MHFFGFSFSQMQNLQWFSTYVIIFSDYHYKLLVPPVLMIHTFNDFLLFRDFFKANYITTFDYLSVFFTNSLFLDLRVYQCNFYIYIYSCCPLI